MSVRPSVPTVQLGSHWTDFYEIWYLSIFRKPVSKIRVSLKSDNNNRYFTWRPMYVFDHISPSSSYNEKYIYIYLHKIYLYKLIMYLTYLTLTLLTWTIWRAPTNASKWQMGFNSAFKGLITCPYPEPARSSPCPPISNFLKIHLNSILPPIPRSSKWPLSPQVSPPKPCMHLCPPPYVLHAPPISFCSIWSPEQYFSCWFLKLICSQII